MFPLLRARRQIVTRDKRPATRRNRTKLVRNARRTCAINAEEKSLRRLSSRIRWGRRQYMSKGVSSARPFCEMTDSIPVHAFKKEKENHDKRKDSRKKLK